jgi:quercetin dioxygenase-like cupin family protein
MRSKILHLESTILKMKQVEIPLEHFFAPGLYLRQMTMPATSVLTGRIHKTEHYCMLLKGVVDVASEAGTTRYTAPAVIHATPGTKRAIYALEETIWVNIHHNPTDEKDLDKIEEIFTAPSYAAFQEYVDNKNALEHKVKEEEAKDEIVIEVLEVEGKK